MLNRKLSKDIMEWIDHGKEALLVTGARQIGKTYIIKECLQNSSHSYTTLNFIENRELVDLFDNASDSSDILLRLSLVSKTPLIKNETIIFLDEVQECKEMITHIKYLVEEGSYKYILSGSLLGVELNDLRSAPVGYLRVMDMYPLNLQEFFNALGIQETTLQHLEKCFMEEKEVDSFVHEKMLDAFYLYLIVGGMPEAVQVYINTNNIQKVKQVHEKISRLYKQDFVKYEVQNKLKLREIYDAMASELDNKNKRFQISKIGGIKRYESVENAFLWLKNAGVALPVYNIQEPKLPLMLSENRSLFKLFYSDVGILTSQYADSVKMKILKKEQGINNGSLFENVVAQELTTHQIHPYYFNSKKQGELDFVIELDGKVVPIELKSGKDYKRHSALCNVLSTSEYQIDKAYILSNYNVKVEDRKIYMPIYMVLFLENSTLNTSIYKLDLTGI
ncbi:ATP-binding protein [Amedibacillus sp. YH-ame6]